MVEHYDGEGRSLYISRLLTKTHASALFQDVTDTYNKVTGMLATALTSPSKQQDTSLPPVSHTMLDLLIILIPHLPASTAVSLFNAASTGNLIENHDAAIQKKCYRILTKLIESEKVASALQGESVDEFVNKLADLSANVGVGAQRVSAILRLRYLLV